MPYVDLFPDKARNLFFQLSSPKPGHSKVSSVRKAEQTLFGGGIGKDLTPTETFAEERYVCFIRKGMVKTWLEQFPRGYNKRNPMSAECWNEVDGKQGVCKRLNYRGKIYLSFVAVQWTVPPCVITSGVSDTNFPQAGWVERMAGRLGRKCENRTPKGQSAQKTSV